MGLVDRVTHSGSISVLDDLVVGLVSCSSGQEGRDSNKSLEVNKKVEKLICNII